MSCLFDSLSKVAIYQNNQISSYDLRQLICDNLDKNPYLIEDLKFDELVSISLGTTKEQYIQNMRNNSEWGSGIEIKCFCNLFRCIVKVHYNNKVIEFLSSNPLFVVNLSYTGSHYELISSSNI